MVAMPVSTFPVLRAGRLERRKARTRTAILEAAEALFRRHGFDGTSITQLSEAADVGVGTLYGYFESKEDILRAIVDRLSVQAMALYSASVHQQRSHFARLCAAIELHARFVREARPILLAALEVSARGESGGLQLAGDVYRAYRGLIQDGIDAGEFRQVPVEAVASAILAACTMSVLGIAGFNRHGDDARTVAELQTMTRLLLAKA